ncbi:MAG TPA: aminopeptidase P family protein [Bacteroidales bacterium]|nr:aminopeptidase P family protein [Bacteroidales bacterium]
MKTIVIPATLFEKNRYKLSHSLKENSVAIFHSNDEMNRTTDQYFPYRQHSDLFYLSGINQEKTTLIISPDHPDEALREILVIRRSNPILETWEGHKLTPGEAGSISGIRTVKYQDEVDSLLAPLMMHAVNVYLNLPEYPKFIPELPCRNLRYAEELRKRFPAHNYERLASIMRDLRVIKSADETGLIRLACMITRDAFMRVLKTTKPGMMEYEVEAEIIYEFIKNGSRGHAYQPIIASGINACTLHYIDNNKTLEGGELVLMDFGAEYGNYAADCTRTIPVSGRFTERQKDLYKSVLDVFKFACTLMKPGSSINKVHGEVCRRFGQEHVRLGLYTADELEKQDKNTPLYQQYYMHGTSHFLGLDVHDVGSKDAEFRPGMVLTCEPALYLPAEKTGIRLESNILITGDGHIDLMQDIPIQIEDIESMMN